MALDLDLLVEEKRVSGSASIEFSRVSPDATQLVLDAVGFEIQSVSLAAGDEMQPIEWQYDGDHLYVPMPIAVKDGVLQVEYSVAPRRGLYFLEPDLAVPDRPRQVWSQCQDQDARYWFPCHDAPDAKMSSELRVTVPDGWVALSNGELIEEPGDEAGERVYHFMFDAAHPSYLMTLVAGEFSVLEDRPAQLKDGRAVAVLYYVPKGREQDAWRSLGLTPQIIEHFSEVTGVPYPWSRYSQVVVADFTFGGMENTTATTLYEHALLDERAALDITSVDLVAHELAHQWFGDYVTCRDWSEAWLNEGFATYFEHVERERRLGRDEYDWGVQCDLETYLSEAAGHYTRPIVCREFQAPIDLFDRHLYEKGGLVLHMLRRLLGDAVFFESLREYLGKYQHSSVETSDLKRTCERVSGRSLDRFFDQWVHTAGHPELEVTCGYEEGLLTVSATQKLPEGMAPFEWDFEIEFTNIGGQVERLKRTVTTAHAAHVVRLVQRPLWVAFDPDFRVTVPVQLDFPADILRNALAKAKSLRSRVLAAQGLAKRFDRPSMDALQRCLGDEQEPWMLRGECARGLGKLHLPESLNILLAALSVEHPKVRRSVVAALGNFRDAQLLSALQPVALNDISYSVQAQACRTLGQSRQPGALEVLHACLNRDSHANMVQAAAYEGLASLREPSALEWVRQGTRYGVPMRARRAAIAALAKLGDGRRVREELEELLDDANFYIRTEAAHALVQLGDVQAVAALEQRLSTEHEGRVVRAIREAINALSSSSADALRRVTDDVASLQRKIEELRARMERMEADKRAPTSERPLPAVKKSRSQPQAPKKGTRTIARKPMATKKAPRVSGKPGKKSNKRTRRA